MSIASLSGKCPTSSCSNGSATHCSGLIFLPDIHYSLFLIFIFPIHFLPIIHFCLFYFFYLFPRLFFLFFFLPPIFFSFHTFSFSFHSSLSSFFLSSAPFFACFLSLLFLTNSNKADLSFFDFVMRSRVQVSVRRSRSFS